MTFVTAGPVTGSTKLFAGRRRRMEDVLELVLDPEKQSNYAGWDFFLYSHAKSESALPESPKPAGLGVR